MRECQGVPGARPVSACARIHGRPGRVSGTRARRVLLGRGRLRRDPRGSRGARTHDARRRGLLRAHERGTAAAAIAGQRARVHDHAARDARLQTHRRAPCHAKKLEVRNGPRARAARPRQDGGPHRTRQHASARTRPGTHAADRTAGVRIAQRHERLRARRTARPLVPRAGEKKDSPGERARKRRTRCA